jgi:hypothetical protein
MDLRVENQIGRSMHRIPLESSALASVLYLPQSRELEVAFLSGEIYRYLDVPPQAFWQLLAAPSKGSYYNFNIRKRFSFLKLNIFTSAQPGSV